MKFSPVFSLACIVALFLSVLIFFGGFIANPLHPLSSLYDSLFSLGLGFLFGCIYYYLLKRDE